MMLFLTLRQIQYLYILFFLFSWFILKSFCWLIEDLFMFCVQEHEIFSYPLYLIVPARYQFIRIYSDVFHKTKSNTSLMLTVKSINILWNNEIFSACIGWQYVSQSVFTFLVLIKAIENECTQVGSVWLKFGNSTLEFPGTWGLSFALSQPISPSLVLTSGIHFSPHHLQKSWGFLPRVVAQHDVIQRFSRAADHPNFYPCLVPRNGDALLLPPEGQFEKTNAD